MDFLMMLDMGYVNVHEDTTMEQIESDMNEKPPQLLAEIYHHAEGYECHQDRGDRANHEHCTSMYPHLGHNRMDEEWSIINHETDHDQGPWGQEGVEDNQLAGLELNTHYLDIPGYGALPIFEIREPSPVHDHHIWLVNGSPEISLPASPVHYDSESPTSMLVNLSGSDRSLEQLDYFAGSPDDCFNRTLSVTTLIRHAGIALAPRGYHFLRSPLRLTEEPRRRPGAPQTPYPVELELRDELAEEADV